MPCVVIAAHNEAAVIGRCLSSLSSAYPLEVIVVPNGCTDETADVARAAGAAVIEIATAGKTDALNAGDAVAKGFPRFYLDADIVLESGTIDEIVDELTRSRLLAASPERYLDLEDRPILVRAYFAINARLPVFTRSLFGRGLIVLSEAGRSRFESFPTLTSDDLFLDSLFTDQEKTVVKGAVVTVATPRKTSDLVRRLVRVRRGNAAMRRSTELPGTMRRSDRLSWFKDVVAPDLRLLPAGIAYIGITSLAALLARFSSKAKWGRDDSSRIAGAV